MPALCDEIGVDLYDVRGAMVTAAIRTLIHDNMMRIDVSDVGRGTATALRRGRFSRDHRDYRLAGSCGYRTAGHVDRGGEVVRYQLVEATS